MEEEVLNLLISSRSSLASLHTPAHEGTLELHGLLDKAISKQHVDAWYSIFKGEGIGWSGGETGSVESKSCSMAIVIPQGTEDFRWPAF